MQESMRSPQSSTAPSVWVKRFLPLIKPGGLVLDLAAGSGRHVRLLRDCGFAVCAVDRDTTALLAFAGLCCEVCRIDLETDDRRQLGDDYDGIIVTNYLHRPLLPAIARALAPGGVADLRDLRVRQRTLRPAAQSRFPASPRRVARGLYNPHGCRLRTGSGFGATPRRDPAPCRRTRPDGPVAGGSRFGRSPVDRVS